MVKDIWLKKQQKRDAVAGKVRESLGIRRTHSMLAGSENGKRGHTHVMECGQPLEAENDTWLRASKEMETSVLQPQGN